MMTDKKIIIVYQDCFLCGSRKKTIPKKLDKLTNMGYEVVAIGFTDPIADPLIVEAVRQGIGSMPFYTDGKYFAATIDGLIEQIIPRKMSKKTKKTKEVENGTDPET